MTSTPHDRPSMPQPASPEYAHPLPSAPPLGASGIVLPGLTKQYQRGGVRVDALAGRSEEHTSELQSRVP